MLMRGFQETTEAFYGLLESFGEFALLLIAPGGFETAHLSVQPGQKCLQIVVKPIEILAKTAEFRRIDAGF